VSYSLGLDEYRESTLLREIEERKAERAAGRCDYCHRPHGVKPACRFPERHDGEVT
jgi:hypothetical protein